MMSPIYVPVIGLMAWRYGGMQFLPDHAAFPKTHATARPVRYPLGAGSLRWRSER